MQWSVLRGLAPSPGVISAVPLLHLDDHQRLPHPAGPGGPLLVWQQDAGLKQNYATVFPIV